MRCDPIDSVAGSAAHDCGPQLCRCGTRRSFLKSIAALGAGTTLTLPAIWTQGSACAEPAASAKPHRIDVHHHMFPPFVQELWKKSNIRTAPVVRRWTVDATLDQMNRAGVATTILSVLGSGGFNMPKLNAAEHRRLTRMANDYAVKLRSEHPGRFGTFAFVPMPDLDGTLKEIEYALDVIKADGIWVSTGYGNRFLGDPDFRAVLDEFNRRKAVVYVHPSPPECCGRLMPNGPGSFTEYPQDTNRTVMSLLFSGAFARTRDVRWIFSHAGAAVPLLAGRVNSLAKIQLKSVAQVLPDGIDFELKRLHYETANATDASNMAALLKYVPASQVLFGTDYPYVTVVENATDLMQAGLSPAELRAIDNENASRLMPQLKFA